MINERLGQAIIKTGPDAVQQSARPRKRCYSLKLVSKIAILSSDRSSHTKMRSIEKEL